MVLQHLPHNVSFLLVDLHLRTHARIVAAPDTGGVSLADLHGDVEEAITTANDFPDLPVYLYTTPSPLRAAQIPG
jgi:hypothetical protein